MSHNSELTQPFPSVEGGVDIFIMYMSHKQYRIWSDVYRLRGTVSLNNPEGKV